MVMIRFTKFTDKILSHVKKRTIRKKRKCNCGASIIVLPKRYDGPVRYKRDKCICQIKKGDTLQVYIVIKLGEAEVTNVKKLDYLHEMTDEDAKLDGFRNKTDAIIGLMEMHNKDDKDFRIIEWEEPSWEKMMLVKESEIEDVKKLLL